MKKLMKPILFTSIFILMSVSIVILLTHSFKPSPTEYLCDKYGFDKSKLECVEYSPKHYFYDINYWSSGWTAPTWFYEYEGNEFIVKKFNDEFRDDYQFDEFCNWSIDFLNSQTEYTIVSMDLKSDKFFDFNHILNETDYKSILYSMDGYTIYIMINNIGIYIDNEEELLKTRELVEKNIKNIGFINNNAIIFLVDETVGFENKITYYNGDRNYISEHSSLDDITGLKNENKIIFALTI